jgi:hypothetical protein
MGAMHLGHGNRYTCQFLRFQVGQVNVRRCIVTVVGPDILTLHDNERVLLPCLEDSV